MRTLLLRIIALSLAAAPLVGCNPKASVKIEPIEVKPIYMTLDINIKVDRELDEFFGFEDQATHAPQSDESTSMPVEGDTP